MNKTVKCESKPMTVTTHNSIILSDQLNANNAVYSPRSGPLSNGQPLLGILSSASVPLIPTIGQTNQQVGHHSSLILRQKLLHRKNGPNSGASTGSTRSYRKSNNGFKFHNFVVNQDKSACLEEQHGTKKISVSHWKRHADDVNDDVNPVQLNTENSPEESINNQQSILEALLAPSDQPKKLNKRKPSHVRRVLRPEVNEFFEQKEPLDLSVKRTLSDEQSEEIVKNCKMIKTKNKHGKHCDNQTLESPSESIQHLIKSVNRSAAQASAIIASVRCPKNNGPSVSGLSNRMSNTSIAQTINTSGSSLKQHRQRQTQRSLIKKQLEDAFKQNGFLVKTKQVSDANNSAMFCKFRQLRKYTRYYLKSWHHHLPDEVNKLWKGFLPPKTAKPNSSQTQL